MPERCPRCREKLGNPRALVCPACGYSLRLPLVGMAGAVLVVGGLLSFGYALFMAGDEWFQVVLTGVGAIVAGMVALLLSALLVGRAPRA